MTDNSPSETPSSHGILGTLALVAGVVLLVGRSLEAVQSLPGLPRFWHRHDALWIGLGFVAIAFGVWLLARTSSAIDHDGWRPTRSGRRFDKLILYTRPGCHLCDEARRVLDEHRRWLPEIIEVDIDHDPRLVERYGTCVPVVSLDGKVRFRGKVSAELLRRLIEGTPASYENVP